MHCHDVSCEYLVLHPNSGDGLAVVSDAAPHLLVGANVEAPGDHWQGDEAVERAEGPRRPRCRDDRLMEGPARAERRDAGRARLQQP